MAVTSIDKIKYVIITPIRDEAENIETTIKSMISQTVKPVEWIIVNDGSTDNTGEIIDRYAEQHSWIKTIHRGDRGFRKSGTGVIEAFYDGYDSLEFKDYDFIVKLDGDLSFEEGYFRKCFEYFSDNPKLGIGGGDVYNSINGKLDLEKNPAFHVRGATKIYKRECWDAIGGVVRSTGWDTIDEVKANMLGFKTYSFKDLKLLHLRSTGEADGAWRNAIKNGMANYISGYHPLFMILKCIKRIPSKPYLMESAGILLGFIKGYVNRVPQVDDAELIRYVRKQQIMKLLFRPSMWK